MNSFSFHVVCQCTSYIEYIQFLKRRRYGSQLIDAPLSSTKEAEGSYFIFSWHNGSANWRLWDLISTFIRTPCLPLNFSGLSCPYLQSKRSDHSKPASNSFLVFLYTRWYQCLQAKSQPFLGDFLERFFIRKGSSLVDVYIKYWKSSKMWWKSTVDLELWILRRICDFRASHTLNEGNMGTSDQPLHWPFRNQHVFYDVLCMFLRGGGSLSP